MDSDLIRTINWRSTGYGIGFFACKIVGWVYPEANHYCDVAEAFIVSGGLVAAADATRVHNIAQAVDGLLGLNKISPASIVMPDSPKVG